MNKTLGEYLNDFKFYGLNLENKVERKLRDFYSRS